MSKHKGKIDFEIIPSLLGVDLGDNAIHDDVASEISAVAEKVTPVNADLVLIEDSAAGNVKKRVQVGNLPGGGGGGLVTKSGVVLVGAFTGNPKTATVTFAGAFSDANYSPVCTTNGQALSCFIQTKLAASFIINLGSNNVGSLVEVDWTATKHGET